MPNLTLLLLGLGVLLNIIFFRIYKGAVGLLFLFSGCASFIIFANCCAYNVRNGYFSLSFFIASAFVGYSSLEIWLARVAPNFVFRKPNELRMSFPVAACAGLTAMIIALVALTFEFPNDRLIEKGSELKNAQIGIATANQFILRNAKVLKKYDTFASAYAPAKYLPLTEDIFMKCKRTNASRAARAKKQSLRALIFSYPTFENDASRKYIKESLANKSAIIIDGNGALVLYEFR